MPFSPRVILTSHSTRPGCPDPLETSTGARRTTLSSSLGPVLTSSVPSRLALRDHTGFAYEELKADGRTCPVHVYVSTADVDSCCAFRILKSMMCSDGIPFSAYPVGGYQELQNLGDKLPKDGQNRSVVLINCGGTENVKELMSTCSNPQRVVFPCVSPRFKPLRASTEGKTETHRDALLSFPVSVSAPADLPENTRVFVFDSHRPLDLENTRGDNRDVLVLRDEREGEETFPEPDSSDEDSDSDDGSDSDAESDDELDDSEREKENANETGSEGKRKRGSSVSQKADRARDRKLRRQERRFARVAYYSRGSFHGRAAGLIMYDIAHDTHKDSLEKHFPLWLAIVSLTDQYVHQRLSHEQYTAGVMELAAQVSNLPSADAPTERVLDEGAVVRAFEDRRVSYSEEFRFSMLRHWSLYDAMTHSPYVATRMQIWKEAGRASLHSLLAHLGLPLEACKQQYAHMSPEHVKQLHSKLERHGPTHGLDDLKFWSFSFSHGFKTKLVAADVVYGATALLEGVPSSTGAEKNEEGESGEGGVGGASNFWRAVKALGMSQYDEMRVGLRHAMRSQRALMRQGGLALANKTVIRTVGGLRYFSLLDHGSPSDVALFKHPLALLRLALFLQDALRMVKKIERPLVVVGPSSSHSDSGNDPSSGLASVVGVTGKPRADDAESGNHFSSSFRRAAETVRARFKHDSFEASVVHVAERDLGEFMEALSDIDAERVARERMNAAA